MGPSFDLQSIALIGTYVPRMCGIATFTKDLHDALTGLKADLRPEVLAMDDAADGYSYPPEVRFRIKDSNPKDYSLAADLLNIEGIDAAILQHEYGIYGGESGVLVLDFVRHLRVPLITTLHTVLTAPSALQREIVVELSRCSQRLVVLCSSARELLGESYGIAAEKIAVIPHGIPDPPSSDSPSSAEQLDLAGHTVLMTFGLLAPGKSIEVVIRALPEIVTRHPEVVYLVLGATHPNELARQGNAYVTFLERMASSCGVRDRVFFHNRYLPAAELHRFLRRADLYVTPYANPEQIVSGTLAFAMGMGKAVLSTPYRYAEEMLADGRGVLFPFGDSTALAREVCSLLDNPPRRRTIMERAYRFSRSMVWSDVGRQYFDLAGGIIAERRRSAFHPAVSLAPHLDGVPEINLGHLRTLTDDTGILQHALYTVPNRNHGYCTDDNARALIAAARCFRLTRDRTLLGLAARYMSFVHSAFDPSTRRFRNFMSYQRHWVDSAAPSEDAFGRALWALGSVVSIAPSDAMRTLARELFLAAVPSALELGSPRAWACTLLGCHCFRQGADGDAIVRDVQLAIARRLFEAFRSHGTDEWPWCEDVVTYANASLPHALILSGQATGEPEMAREGLRSLRWLVDTQLSPDGTVNLIGNKGWMRRDAAPARFDQQPIDAMSLVEASAAAWRYTRDHSWREHARRFLGWFLGNNVGRVVLYDSTTGGCHDGLQPDGANLNEGAESTLSWLLSLLSFQQLDGDAGHQVATGGTDGH